MPTHLTHDGDGSNRIFVVEQGGRVRIFKNGEMTKTFYGDYCSGLIWGLKNIAGAWQSMLLLDSPYSISTFGEDEPGNLYVADYTSGQIFRIQDTHLSSRP